MSKNRSTFLKRDEIKPGTLISGSHGSTSAAVAIILGKPGEFGARYHFVKAFVFSSGGIRQLNANYLRRVQNEI